MPLGYFESGGGGFSNRFPAPDYQKRAVKPFLDGLQKTDPAHLKLFNTKGVSLETQIQLFTEPQYHILFSVLILI